MAHESAVKPHIVLIEDNPSDAFLIKMALEESGIESEMTNFQSGAAAVKSLCPRDGAQKPPPVDLILLDLNTPCSDGFSVLSAIRGDSRYTGLPIAIVTSSASAADQARASLMGATVFIQKPTELPEFLDCIGKAVKRLLPSFTQSAATLE